MVYEPRHLRANILLRQLPACTQVDEHLRVEGFRDVFAVGDATNVKETKLGYLAAAQVTALVVPPRDLPTPLQEFVHVHCIQSSCGCCGTGD